GQGAPVGVVDRFSRNPSPPTLPPRPRDEVDLSPCQRLGLQSVKELPTCFPSEGPLVIAALRVTGVEAEAVRLPVDVAQLQLQCLGKPQTEKPGQFGALARPWLRIVEAGVQLVVADRPRSSLGHLEQPDLQRPVYHWEVRKRVSRLLADRQQRVEALQV